MNKFTLHLLLISGCFAAFAAACLNTVIFNLQLPDESLEAHLIYTVACCLYCFIALISGTISLSIGYLAVVLPVTDLHRSVNQVLLHYGVAIYYRYVAWRFWRRFQAATKNVAAVQGRTLEKMLRDNALTEYGRKMRFDLVKDKVDFQQKHPICDYEPFRPYVDRMETNGETNLLTSRDVCTYYTSSGTTGKPKIIPGCIESVNARQEGAFLWNFLPLLLPPKPYVAPLKTLSLYFIPKWRQSVDGMSIGPASVYPPGYRLPVLGMVRSSPEFAQVTMPEQAQTFIHWLFALMDRNLARIDAVYGGALVVAFEFLVQNWRVLATTVRRGQISVKDAEHFGILPNLIEPLNQLLWPNTQRADEMERHFVAGDHDDYGAIAVKLWPRITQCYVIVTGAHTIYIERLQHFLGDKVHIYSSVYVSSECGAAAVNLNHPQFKSTFKTAKNDGHELFTFIPNGGVFYEFIPITEQVDLDKPTSAVFMEDLKVGQRYEVVLSSDTCGFYRYRLGDIVEVKGHYNQSPVVEFCGRSGSLLDLRGEKTSEDMILSALKNCIAKKLWPFCSGLANFTSTECMSLRKTLLNSGKTMAPEDDGKLFYVIFVELHQSGDTPLRQFSAQEINHFDMELRQLGDLVEFYRVKEAIAIPRMFVLSPGSFDALKQRTLERTGAVSNQYKTPRYVKTEDAIQFLLNRVL